MPGCHRTGAAETLRKKFTPPPMFHYILPGFGKLCLAEVQNKHRVHSTPMFLPSHDSRCEVLNPCADQLSSVPDGFNVMNVAYLRVRVSIYDDDVRQFPGLQNSAIL